MALKNWMAWEAGIEIVAGGLTLKIARMVHTPVGSARGGLIVWQPDTANPPELYSFITTDSKVGDYLATHMFRNTPFSEAPPALADIGIDVHPDDVLIRVETPGRIFEIRLSGISTPAAFHREPTPADPYITQSIRSDIHRTEVKLNGAPIDFPHATACFSPCGHNARD